MPPASKLSLEIQTTISRLVAVGNDPAEAAKTAGINRATYYRWLERGRQKGKANAPYRAFAAEIERARAEAEMTLVTRIAKAAQSGSWSAAAWLLERRAPERWGKEVSTRNADESTEEPEERSGFEGLYPDEIAQRRDAKKAQGA